MPESRAYWLPELLEPVTISFIFVDYFDYFNIDDCARDAVGHIVGVVSLILSRTFFVVLFLGVVNTYQFFSIYQRAAASASRFVFHF